MLLRHPDAAAGPIEDLIGRPLNQSVWRRPTSTGAPRRRVRTGESFVFLLEFAATGVESW